MVKFYKGTYSQSHELATLIERFKGQSSNLKHAEINNSLLICMSGVFERSLALQLYGTKYSVSHKVHVLAFLNVR